MKQSYFYKRKLFLSITVFLSLIISCRGSSKSDNDYLKNIPVDVYVGGRFYIDSSVSFGRPVAVYWKNGEMVSLTTKPSYVASIAVAGNDVYAGGYYKKQEPSIAPYALSDVETEVRVPAYWKNGKLVSLSALSKYGSAVKTIVVSGNDVYAGGYSLNREEIAIAGYWKNQKWVSLVPINSKYSSSVETIFVSGNDIYAGGYNNAADYIPGYWKNGEWTALPFISERKSAHVYSMFVSGNDVYVSGYSRNNSGINIACYWKNGEIIPLMPLDSKYESRGVSIFVLGNDVYVGGYFKDNSRINIACYWKNGELIQLAPIVSMGSEVTSLFVFGKDVYAGGYSSLYTRGIPGYWKNGNWVGLNTEGLEGTPPPVSSIVVVPRQLDNKYGDNETI